MAQSWFIIPCTVTSVESNIGSNHSSGNDYLKSFGTLML